jgi:hypothetical protein
MKTAAKIFLTLSLTFVFGICQAQETVKKKQEVKKEKSSNPKFRKSKKGASDKIDVSDQGKPKNQSPGKKSNNNKATLPKN